MSALSFMYGDQKSMKRIARFEKVSYDRFCADWKKCFGDQYTENEIRAIHENLKLPARATKYSAGYDFFAPADLTFRPGETIRIPTGVRVYMEPEWVLNCYPRSSLGFKYRLQLDNTVGIVDSDYYWSDNEGHIFAKLTNCTNEDKTLLLQAGTGFMQGIFLEYGITMDDDVDTVRNGGIGSTSTKN